MLEPGDQVKVVEGPFADVLAEVEDVNLERRKVMVRVIFFEKEEQLELNLAQVEKV